MKLLPDGEGEMRMRVSIAEDVIRKKDPPLILVSDYFFVC